MSNDAKDTLKESGTLEGLLQDAYLDYLNNCRTILSKKYKSEHDIDSEVSLYFHYMLEEFDKYRTNRK